MYSTKSRRASSPDVYKAAVNLTIFMFLEMLTFNQFLINFMINCIFIVFYSASYLARSAC